MPGTILGAIALSLASVALLGCKAEAPTGSDQVLPGALERFGLTDWSEPQLVGPPVNTTASEQNGTLAKDGLTLYFTSDRNDGRGGLDIWISKRLTTESPWGTPENLEAINTPSADFAPNLSTDGHLLFFSSNRPGVLPVSIDIFVSRRADPNDDQGWGPPTRWGPGVNTPDAENAPMYLQSAEDGSVNLYFNRGVLTASLQRCGGVDPRRWAGDLLLVDARRESGPLDLHPAERTRRMDCAHPAGCTAQLGRRRPDAEPYARRANPGLCLQPGAGSGR